MTKPLQLIDEAERAFEDNNSNTAISTAKQALSELLKVKTSRHREMRSKVHDTRAYAKFIISMSLLSKIEQNPPQEIVTTAIYDEAWEAMFAACTSKLLQACDHHIHMPTPKLKNHSHQEKQNFEVEKNVTLIWSAERAYKETGDDYYGIQLAKFKISSYSTEERMEAFQSMKQFARNNKQAKSYLGNWYLIGHSVVPYNEAEGLRLLREAGIPADRGKKSGLGKWIDKELIPTLSGKRSLEIKPYVKVTHSGNKLLQLAPNSLHIEVGGVTLKTTKLAKRLGQLKCIVSTYNIIGCAPDVVERETARVYDCLLYTSPSPRDQRGSRMPSSA